MLTALASTALLAQALPGGLLGIAIIFFIIAIIAYVLGAQGVAGMSAGVGTDPAVRLPRPGGADGRRAIGARRVAMHTL
jgi:hypothetical protein